MHAEAGSPTVEERRGTVDRGVCGSEYTVGP